MGESELISAGLSDMHARHLLDLLGDDGLTLGDLATWDQQQQKARLSEAFPLMSQGKIEQVLKKLRLLIYDTQHNEAPLMERPPSGQIAAERSRDGRRPIESRDDNVALSAISHAMEHISSASKTWIDIADAADGLLMYEREEDAKNWKEHQEFLRAHTRVAEFNQDDDDNDDDSEADSPIFKLAPSKLIPHPPGAGPQAESETPATMKASPPPKQKNEPAPWKRKDKLYQLLNEQQKDDADAPDVTMDSTAASDQKSIRNARTKRARNRAQKDMEQATRAKPDYHKLIDDQRRELAFVEGLHLKYREMVNKLLQEQANIEADMDDNPWDLTLGMVFDNKERHLKRKLLHLIGAAPEPDEEAINAIPTRKEDVMIAQELDDLVALIDDNGDGLLTNDELEERLVGDPELMLRLQALRINMALSSENTLQGENSKTRRAMMQLQLRSVHAKMDLDQNGYIDVEELIEVGTKNPELTQKLQTLGVHLKSMLQVAKKDGLAALQSPRHSPRGSPRQLPPSANP